MREEHSMFVAELNKELWKQGTNFDQFLANTKLETLMAKNSPEGRKFELDKEGTVVRQLNNVDVIFGRGNSIAKHPGNWMFRQAVAQNKAYYKFLYRDAKSDAANQLVVEFLRIGTRFLEEVNPGCRPPVFQIVSRARVTEKFCQGLREKKFATSGLVDAAKGGAVIKQTRKEKVELARKKAARTRKKRKIGYNEDDDDSSDFSPKSKPKAKKQKIQKNEKKKQTKKSTASKGKAEKSKPISHVLLAPHAETATKTASTGAKKKKLKQGEKTKAKTQKDTKKKKTKGTSSSSSEKINKKKTKKAKSAVTASVDDSQPAATVTPDSKVSKPPGTAKSGAKSENAARQKQEPSSYDQSMQSAWSRGYGAPYFYNYPHFSPYFHPHEHYQRHSGSASKGKGEDHEAAAATVMPPYPMPYPDPRVVSPLVTAVHPNASFWRKRQHSKKDDKEFLARFMESYEDCRKYAHEICRSHKDTVMERFPVDDEAENLVKILKPSKLRKLNSDVVPPMPIFHDST